jgi:hypothetical protein
VARVSVGIRLHGETDAQGAFALTTYTPNDGAAPGGYQILLLWPAEAAEASEGEESTTDRLFNWYDAAHTKLAFTVKTDGNNVVPTINIPLLKGPPPEIEGIPGKN